MGWDVAPGSSISSLVSEWNASGELSIINPFSRPFVAGLKDRAWPRVVGIASREVCSQLSQKIWLCTDAWARVVEIASRVLCPQLSQKNLAFDRSIFLVLCLRDCKDSSRVC